MSCNPVAGFERYRMGISAPVFGLQNWRKWQWFKWKQRCRCVIPGPHVLVLNGFSTNSNCSMGIIKKTCTEKKYFFSFPVSQSQTAKRLMVALRNAMTQKLWKILCKASDRLTCLNIIFRRWHYLIWKKTSSVLTCGVGFFSVNRSTIFLSTHPEAFGSVRDEFAVKDKWTEWRAIENGLCRHCSAPWWESCFV